MKKETLEKANELEKLIEVTERGLGKLKEMQKKNIENPVKDNKHLKDNMYSLSISEHSDGSGIKAELNRYLGNERLIAVLVAEVEHQLNDYKKQFNSL